MNSLVIAANIIKRAFKSTKEIILVLLLPVAAIGIMTIMMGTPSLQKLKVGIIVEDKGIYSTKLASILEKDQSIHLVRLTNTNYKALLKNGKVNAVLTLPEDFSTGIENSRKIELSFYCNKSSAAVEELKQHINQYVSAFYQISSSSADIALQSGKDKSLITEDLFKQIENGVLQLNYSLGRTDSKEENKNGLISSIGFSIMFIMVLVFNTIGTILEDKKNLVLARISTFKVRQWEIVAGNLLGSLALGVIQLIPLTLITAYVYKLSSLKEIMGLFLILVCFITATIGLAIGLAGIIQANFNPALIVATIIFPTCLIGGCLIPASMLPDFIDKIGYVVPQKWVLISIQKLMTGEDLQNIFINLGIILMFGLAFMTFGAKTMKPLDEA